MAGVIELFYLSGPYVAGYIKPPEYGSSRPAASGSPYPVSLNQFVGYIISEKRLQVGYKSIGFLSLLALGQYVKGNMSRWLSGFRSFVILAAVYGDIPAFFMSFYLCHCAKIRLVEVATIHLPIAPAIFCRQVIAGISVNKPHKSFLSTTRADMFPITPFQCIPVSIHKKVVFSPTYPTYAT